MNERYSLLILTPTPILRSTLDSPNSTWALGYAVGHTGYNVVRAEWIQMGYDGEDNRLQGGAVVRARLNDKQYVIRGVTRNTESEASIRLKQQGKVKVKQ